MSYCNRTIIICNISGKILLSFVGNIAYGATITILLPTMLIQSPFEYIITGKNENVKAGFDFLDNFRNELNSLWTGPKMYRADGTFY